MEEVELFSPLNQELKNQILESEEPVSITMSYWDAVWIKLRDHRFALAGLLVFLGIFFMAVVGPLMSYFTLSEIQLELKNQPPNLTFWFGTDELGRDFFTRCWWGARISLFVGFAASFIDLLIGVLFGSIAGYAGGKVDECMMRIADVLNTVPYFLVVILVMVIIGPGIATIVIALSLTGWINMARIVRTQVLQIKGQDYIKAVLTFGGSHKRILFKHLIPNIIGPIIVTLTFTIPTAIFSEAFLSFLGLGIQSPYASLGTLASDGLAAIRYYPWRLIIPALLICLSTLSLNLLGDGLREALDPKHRPNL